MRFPIIPFDLPRFLLQRHFSPSSTGASKTNFDHPSSLDFDLLRLHLLELIKGRAIEQPIYNFKTHEREKTTRVGLNRLK
jgi:uridine kinase